MLTGVRGGNQIRLMIPKLEDPGQDFWWKLVDGYICVLGDFEYLQNLREALLDVGDLQTTESSMTRRFRDL